MPEARPEPPWVPDEPEPAGGWPAAPAAVPVVVARWRRLPAGSARPARGALRSRAVAVKADAPDRVRRFAEAWAWLRQERARVDWPRGWAATERLVIAGLLLPARALEARRPTRVGAAPAAARDVQQSGGRASEVAA
jgi:hypothetical protein